MSQAEKPVLFQKLRRLYRRRLSRAIYEGDADRAGYCAWLTVRANHDLGGTETFPTWAKEALSRIHQITGSDCETNGYRSEDSAP
jgi:hypothetical protein